VPDELPVVVPNVVVPDLASAGPGVVAPEPIVPVTPPAPRAPDGILLTKREMESLIERATSAALEAHKKVTMPEPKIETPPPAVTAEDLATLRAEMAAQKAETDARVAAAETRAAAAEQKAADAERKRRVSREKVVEAQLKAVAATAGIEDQDYALMLYARAAAAAVGNKDEKGEPAPLSPPEPATFFAELRKTKPVLFKDQPTVLATTTPAPTLTSPPPAGPPPSTEVKTVDDMDHRDFNARTRDKYGFSPSLVS
jgi:hypothetical protein